MAPPAVTAWVVWGKEVMRDVVRFTPAVLFLVFMLAAVGATVWRVVSPDKPTAPALTRPAHMSQEEWDYMTTEFRNAGMSEAEAAEAASAGGAALRAQEQRPRR